MSLKTIAWLVQSIREIDNILLDEMDTIEKVLADRLEDSQNRNKMLDDMYQQSKEANSMVGCGPDDSSMVREMNAQCEAESQGGENEDSK